LNNLHGMVRRGCVVRLLGSTEDPSTDGDGDHSVELGPISPLVSIIPNEDLEPKGQVMKSSFAWQMPYEDSRAR
jgi:hypothetical protein